MELEKLNITESKAAAYDTLAEIERLQLQLKAINNHIANLYNSTKAVEITKEETKA